MIRVTLVALTLSLSKGAALAHDQWADESPVPPWVKSMCCGENDVHRDARMRFEHGDIYVEGLTNPVDPEKVFDSRDGHVWAFYSPYAGQNAVVYCLFIPPTI